MDFDPFSRDYFVDPYPIYRSSVGAGRRGKRASRFRAPPSRPRLHSP